MSVMVKPGAINNHLKTQLRDTNTRLSRVPVKLLNETHKTHSLSF